MHSVSHGQSVVLLGVLYNWWCYCLGGAADRTGGSQVILVRMMIDTVM